MFYTIPKNNGSKLDLSKVANTLESMNDLVDADSLYEMDTHMIPVTEGYIGKTKNLLEIERKFDEMIKKYGPRSRIDKSYHDLEDCPEKKDIQDLVCREFGFDSASIIIQPVAISNAMTMPRSFLVRDFTNGMPTSLTLHGEKYYDASHKYDFVMVMYTELFDGTFTAGELTAFLLHEVGHNFDVTTMTYIADWIFWGQCLATGNVLYALFRNYAAKIIWRIENLLLRIRPLTILMNIGIDIYKILLMVTGPLGIPTRLARILQNTIVRPIDLISGIGAEKFADSFANAYGYGAEMISVVDKMDRYLITTNKGVVADTWTWMGDACCSIITMFIDPHPENQTRARMMLDDMKKLSESKDIPPHIRKVVQKDYQACKKAYDDFLQVEKSDRDGLALRLSRNFKEDALNGKVSFFTYFFTCSAVQSSGRRHGREWS